jgi:hypothetical protein
MQQGFDVYSIESGVHVRAFRDHDHSSETQPFPALFIQGGKWLLGGGIGKAIIWHVGSGTQVQVLLNDGELTHPVQHLAVCLISLHPTFFMHIRQHTIVLLMVSVFKLRLLLTGGAPSHYGAHK